MFLARFLMGIGLTGVLAFTACKKDDNEGSAQGTAEMEMMLTDAPGDYEKVYVDIREVSVNVEGHGWVNLAVIRPGVYNLLDFRNGVDTILTSQQIPAGRLQQIRMVLGTNNSVVVNGVTYPLETPSAEQSGLKFNIHEELQAGVKYVVWVDFDASRSIVLTGSGKYILKPLIRAYLKYNTGILKGDADPDEAVFFVNAINNTDTFTTLTYNGGQFIYFGLPAGTYDINFYNRGGTNVKTVNAVVVGKGAITDMGTVTID